MTAHVRAKTFRARRTSRNAAVAHHLDNPARTVCGAPVTDRDCRLSDCLRAGKLTRWFLEEAELCTDCVAAVEAEGGAS